MEPVVQPGQLNVSFQPIRAVADHDLQLLERYLQMPFLNCNQGQFILSLRRLGPQLPSTLQMKLGRRQVTVELQD